MIKQYIKNISSIEVDKVEASRLPQSKSYLKILGISYLCKNSNTPISANVVEKIIKDNHIFNNIVIASRPRVIKISPKLDMPLYSLIFRMFKVRPKQEVLSIIASMLEVILSLFREQI